MNVGAIELRCPPSIHPSRLRTARELFESKDIPPLGQPEAESFETSVSSWILSLMIIGREITLELYGAPPRSRPALVPKLDAKLRTWLQDVPDDILKNPIGHQSSYHFHFGFHMILHSTWLTIHRELAYLETDDLHSNAQIQISCDAITRSATQIAKLFETFRRTDDARFFHGSGVQWIGLAVDGLSRSLDRVPIDQAIEPLAHLQSLQRTLKILSDYFAQAASLYRSTAAKTQGILRRMEGNGNSGVLPITYFQVPTVPRPRSGPIAHIYAVGLEKKSCELHKHRVLHISDQSLAHTDVSAEIESHQPGFCATDWLSNFSDEDMTMGDHSAPLSLPSQVMAHFGHVQ
jgi:hypothetical protein